MINKVFKKNQLDVRLNLLKQSNKVFYKLFLNL
jgi:hypothetical protein